MHGLNDPREMGVIGSGAECFAANPNPKSTLIATVTRLHPCLVKSHAPDDESSHWSSREALGSERRRQSDYAAASRRKTLRLMLRPHIPNGPSAASWPILQKPYPGRVAEARHAQALGPERRVLEPTKSRGQSSMNALDFSGDAPSRCKTRKGGDDRPARSRNRRCRRTRMRRGVL